MTVVAVAYIQRNDGAVLMQLRPEGRDFPLMWECPGGKVEVGETIEGALKRELREELGIQDYNVTIHAGRDIFRFDPPVVRSPCTLVFCDVELRGRSLDRLMLNASVAVGFFSRKALKQIKLTPGNHRFFSEKGWL